MTASVTRSSSVRVSNRVAGMDGPLGYRFGVCQNAGDLGLKLLELVAGQPAEDHGGMPLVLQHMQGVAVLAEAVLVARQREQQVGGQLGAGREQHYPTLAFRWWSARSMCRPCRC